MAYTKTLWVEDSLPDVTAAQLNRIEQGIADAHAGGTIPFVTSLPISPFDGQEVYFVADATNGVVWHLKYRNADPTFYRWQYIGGPPLAASDATTRAVATAGAWQDTAVSLAVTLPLAGDYDFGTDAHFVPSSGGYLVSGVFNAANAALTGQYGGYTETDLHNEMRVTGVAAGVVKVKYYSSGGTTATVGQRKFDATPVRVG